jgi:hypothetical protein
MTIAAVHARCDWSIIGAMHLPVGRCCMCLERAPGLHRVRAFERRGALLAESHRPVRARAAAVDL